MRIIEKIFNFYIFSNIHVAIAAFCLTKITLLEYGIENHLLPIFVFFSTIAAYNFIRLYRITKVQHWLNHFLNKNKKTVLGLTLISVFILIYQSFFLQLKTLFALVPFGLFSLFYVVPILKKNDSPIALRSISFLKLFLIAFSWAGVTVLVPFINYNIELHSKEIIIFIQRFLILLAITIPFDIRDMNFDNVNLKTLPQYIGIKKSKVVGLFLLMLFLGLEFFKGSTESNYRINFIIALISLFFLLKATEDQNKYYSAFFVESIPIFWLLLVVFMK